MVGQHPKIRFSIRSTERQKTLALKVLPTGEVEVRAPRFIRQAQVRRFVEKRAEWILEKQRYFSELLNNYPPKEFKNGETFPVLGRNYRLRIERQPGVHKPVCRPEHRRLRVNMNGQIGEEFQMGLRGAIREFYSALTQRRVEALIRKHAPALAVSPSKLTVVNQTSRWASCSKTGHVRCNWRLSMMPSAALEYIIVHELCHLRVHDHSVRFWRALKSILPDYERRREWLRRCGPGISSMFS